MTAIFLFTGAILVVAFVFNPQNVISGVVGAILLMLGGMGANGAN